MKSTLLISLIAFGAFAHADVKESKDFPGDGIKSLVIKNGQGDVDIEASPDGRIWVVSEKDKKFPKGCAINMEAKGSTFEITVKGQKEEAGWLDFGSKSCDVDFDIKVPHAVAVDIVSGSGDVEVDGLKSSAKVRTGSGDVSVKYVDMVEEGEVTIKTGSGSAELEFPSTMKITTAFKAGSGKLTKNEFSNSADAKFKVSMEAGSGDLEITTTK